MDVCVLSQCLLSPDDVGHKSEANPTNVTTGSVRGVLGTYCSGRVGQVSDRVQPLL